MAVRSVFGRAGGRAGRGPASVSPVAAAFSVLTIGLSDVIDSLVTTAGPHGVVQGDSVYFFGTSESGYTSQAWTVNGDVPSPTTFVMLLNYQGDSAGGSWSPA